MPAPEPTPTRPDSLAPGRGRVTAMAHRPEPPRVPTLARISDYPGYWAARTPDAIAASGNGVAWTYAELSGEVDRVARGLWQAGIRSRDRVAVLSVPRVEAFVSFLATARLGAIWVGINPRYTVREIAVLLDDSRPSLVATITDFEGRLFAPDIDETLDRIGLNPARVVLGPGSADGFVGWDEFRTAGEQADRAAVTRAVDAVTPDQPALIVYTSGTTGTPKGALLRHYGLVRLGIVEARAFRVPAAPRYLGNAPLNHIGGIGDLAGVALVNGGYTAFRDRFDFDTLIDDLREERISVVFGVPTALQRLAEAATTIDLPDLEVVAWGGAALPVEVVQALADAGFALATTYGSTEATVSVTYSDPDADVVTLASTVGRPDPEVNVRLLGSDGQWITEPGRDGEVTLRHPSTTSGYWRRPEATAALFTTDGSLRTGDIGVFDTDGNLRLIGRASEMFKSGGYNVYPREVELVLETHPQVLAAAVVSRPDARWQEVGVAFVEPVPGADPDPQELRKFTRGGLANFKVPKQVVVLTKLPTLPNQKVDRQELRRRAAALTTPPS